MLSLIIRATKELLKAAEKGATSTAVSGATGITTVPEGGDTLHFTLSTHNLPQQDPQLHPADTSVNHQHTASATPTPTPTHSRLSEYLNHNGPECYVKPQVKSNKKIIKNALCYVCLAGEVNVSLKQRAIAVSV